MERRIQDPETKANWTIVRVAGLGNVVRMVLEEVLVMAEEKYQTVHII